MEGSGRRRERAVKSEKGGCKSRAMENLEKELKDWEMKDTGKEGGSEKDT